MMVADLPLEAVLTGDVVGSSRLPDAVFVDLAARVEAMALAMEGVEFNGFYKGNDGFQCRIPDAAHGLRLALRMRTAAIGIGVDGEGVPLTDLRISIGVGPLAEAGPSGGRTLGAAWVLSGRGLESLKRGDRRLWVEGKDMRTNLAFEGVSRFADFILSKLTVKQAEVLELLLEGKTQTEVAQRLSKSQSTVSSHVQAMGWRELEATLRLYSEAVMKTDK